MRRSIPTGGASSRAVLAEKETLLLGMDDGGFRPISWSGGSRGRSPYLILTVFAMGFVPSKTWSNRSEPNHCQLLF
ncbi:hypothetical protein N8766_00455 [bacterium]|nr:hypothetical protein [bacterium]